MARGHKTRVPAFERAPNLRCEPDQEERRSEIGENDVLRDMRQQRAVLAELIQPRQHRKQRERPAEQERR